MQISTQIFWLAILSMVVASISWTITQEEVFREWREGFEKKSETADNVITRKFYYVFTCEYCFSHWITAIILIFTGFRLLIDDWRGYILAFFLLPWFANQWMSFYRRLRVDIKHEDALAKEVNEKLDSE